jgi:dihydrofolate reductase
MRTIRYGVAMSLDGYIADPKGGYDWIVIDPDIDFTAMYARYDTFIMGRKTYELMQPMGETESTGMKGKTTVVLSRTMRQEDHPDVTVVSEDTWRGVVDKLRRKRGKDIWLFGGGEVFRTLLNAGYVDALEVAIIPVVLGGGIQFLPPPGTLTKLKLTKQRLYKKTGTLMLEYDVVKRRVRRSAGVS